MNYIINYRKQTITEVYNHSQQGQFETKSTQQTSRVNPQQRLYDILR